MDFKIVNDCSEVDWEIVSETLKAVGMAYHSPDKHKRAFEASHTTVFIYSENRLIGFGRALSDGEYQAAIYDCAVWPEYQGQGIGSLIVQNILEQIPGCSVILYASPGKEGFYQKHQFRRMKTGMALFTDSAAKTKSGFTE
ncbi:GNAT family N-acetyltransferase [Desulfotalea psychrophila]|uniref:N-acetyltransferase domain-containing protein n=1 Tax=Desulfotalea psychrophila (strain LSv54 / DSM 12343) TaxID=177439 RepID=Q6AJ37_DESPS|nr:GNAT family N-acetyltransferase [Desulfotalea psychrophila]CAG37643.1 hypothetical protein DP2914 [Desulfotalea psychrophila LSv54]